jgi:seryl-tRNA synthetase
MMNMHSFDFKLPKSISPHLIKDVLAKLAYLDEDVRTAQISKDGSTVTLSISKTPTAELQTTLGERIVRLVGAMSEGRFEPILRIIENNEYAHCGTEDPLPVLLKAHEVIAEGPGFFGLGPMLSALIDLFERELMTVASAFNAVPFRFPALIAPAYMEKVQYFKNFPHSLTFATHLRENILNIENFSAEATTESGRISADPTMYARVPAMLSPTVCHHLYYFLSGKKVPNDGIAATACGHCFRYESSNMVSLERLWNFTMREIIFVGSEEFVRGRLADLQVSVRAILEKFQLSHKLMTANDPFFVGTFRDQVAYQAAFELKYEVQAALPFKQDAVAIGSFNRHGDFFGRSLDIGLQDGEPAHTGCFGIGFERMAYAFVAQHTTNTDHWPEEIRDELAAVRQISF